MNKVLATAFWTSLTTYIVFGLAEYTRPGFVSYHFSLHWFLLLTITFGVAWALAGTYDHTPLRFVRFLSFFAKALLSIVLFILLWKEGAVFGDMRIFLALVAAATPWMLSSGSEITTEYENEY